MNSTIRFRTIVRKATLCRAVLPLSALFAAACGGEASNEDPSGAVPVDEALNLNPANLEEASEAAARIDEMRAENPDDPRAAAALAQLEARLDELNHLVARVELAPGHIVSFYESAPGAISVSEQGPVGVSPVVTEALMDGMSRSELYSLLSGEEAPAALLEAEQHLPSEEYVAASAAAEAELGMAGVSSEDSVQASTTPDFAAAEAAEATGEFGNVQAAVSFGPGDGALFADQGCYSGGNFTDCLPDWGGGGFAQALTKTAFISIAPHTGNGVFVRAKRSNTTTQFVSVPNLTWRRLSEEAVVDPLSCLPFACGIGNLDYLKRTIRWDIEQAATDGFHWSYSFKWTCGSLASCDPEPPL